MNKALISLIIISTLAACTTPEERAEARQLQIEQDNATCKSYGLKEGSETFGNCRLQLDLERKRQYNQPHWYGGYGHYGSHIGIGRRF